LLLLSFITNDVNVDRDSVKKCGFIPWSQAPLARIAEFMDMYFDNSVNTHDIRSWLKLLMARLTARQCITK